MKNLAEGLRERQGQLEVEQRAKRGVEDEMKDKRKDQTKLQREQTSLIQEIKQCVSADAIIFEIKIDMCVCVLDFIFLFSFSGSENEQKEARVIENTTTPETSQR